MESPPSISGPIVHRGDHIAVHHLCLQCHSRIHVSGHATYIWILILSTAIRSSGTIVSLRYDASYQMIETLLKETTLAKKLTALFVRTTDPGFFGNTSEYPDF